MSGAVRQLAVVSSIELASEEPPYVEQVERMVCWHVSAAPRARQCSATMEERAMGGIIYLVGLIVVVMAILSVLGLR